MRLSKESLFVFVNVLFVFSVFTPVYIWKHAFFSQVVIFVFLILACLFSGRLRLKIDKPLLIFIVWVFYTVGLSFVKGIEPKELILYLGLMCFSGYLLILDRQVLIKVFEAFYDLIFAFAILSILTWLFIATNIVSMESMWLLESYEPFKRLEGVFYYTNFVSNWIPQTNYCVNDICASRLMGPLNEPGYWGTLVAFMLIIKKLELSFKNFILFVSGILSLSLAFFILIFVYAAIVLIKQNKKTLFLLAGVVIVFYVVGFFDGLIGYRLMGGEGIRDNRNTSFFLEKINVYINDLAVFFGNGVFSSISILEGSSSFLSVLYDVGVVGIVIFIVFHASYIVRVIRFDSLHAFAFIIVFLLSLYQRPYLLTPGYLFIYLAFVYTVEVRKVAKG